MLPLCDAWAAFFLGFGPQASVPVGVYVATSRCLDCAIGKLRKIRANFFPYLAVDRGGETVPRTFSQLDLGPFCLKPITSLANQRASRWPVAPSLLAQMRELAAEPNTVTCNASISACEKG